jgi:hypothetical protein
LFFKKSLIKLSLIKILDEVIAEFSIPPEVNLKAEAVELNEVKRFVKQTAERNTPA